jgi:hypothetical protein
MLKKFYQPCAQWIWWYNHISWFCQVANFDSSGQVLHVYVRQIKGRLRRALCWTICGLKEINVVFVHSWTWWSKSLKCLTIALLSISWYSFLTNLWKLVNQCYCLIYSTDYLLGDKLTCCLTFFDLDMTILSMDFSFITISWFWVGVIKDRLLIPRVYALLRSLILSSSHLLQFKHRLNSYFKHWFDYVFFFFTSMSTPRLPWIFVRSVKNSRQFVVRCWMLMHACELVDF